MSLADLDTALGQITARRAGYQTFLDYYYGKHRLAFMSDKFRSAFGSLFAAFADNLCPAVVDAVVDRLVITGFAPVGATAPDARVPALPDPAAPPDAPEPPTGDADRAEDATETPPDPADRAWDLWQRNHMDRVAGEVHLEAVRCGDAYVIVWPDAAGVPALDPQPATACMVRYDPEARRRVLWGAKVWAQDDGTVRATLYYPDRLEKYVTAKSTEGLIPDSSRAFVPFTPPRETWPLPNPWGVVPIFPFCNNGGLGTRGRSDLADVIPLQDALNKSVCDMLVAMEFTAFPQRWITGLEVEIDELTGRPLAPFVPGEDRIWAVGDKEVHFGEFPPAGLDNYLHVQDSLRAEIARVSGTPVHYLMLLSGRWPSGEALRIAEVRLTHKILDRSLSFGEAWGAALSLALRMAAGTGAAGADTGAVVPAWQDPAPKSMLELAQELQALQSLGVPAPVLWGLWGFTPEEVTQMQALKAAATPPQLQIATGAGTPTGNGAMPPGGMPAQGPPAPPTGGKP